MSVQVQLKLHLATALPNMLQLSAYKDSVQCCPEPWVPTGRCVSYFYTIATCVRTKGVDYLPLATFHCNCFNILFHDAAGVFFL